MNLERDKEITRRHEITERERTKRLEIAKRHAAIERAPATIDSDTDLDSTFRLVQVVAPHARDFVEPVINRTVDNVVQFPEEEGEIKLGFDEAELILRADDVLTDLRWYRVLEITRINPRTGNCVVLVEEWGRRAWAMINDSTLNLPNNEYTRAENLHLELDVLAPVRLREGSPPKLYIRKAKVREEP